MEQNCSKCGEIVKVIPAGISKNNGKPYNSFYKCKGCGNSVTIGAKAVSQATAQGESNPMNVLIEKLFVKINEIIEKQDKTFDLLQRIEADRAKEAFEKNPITDL